MANIVWSFGIALEAQDDTGDAINAVIGRVRDLNRTLGRMDEASQTSVDTINSLRTAESRLADTIDRTGQSVDHTTKLFGSFEHSVAAAVETTITAVGRLARGVFNAPINLATSLTKTLMDLPNIVARWVFDTDLHGLVSGLNAAHDATERFLDLGNAFAPIDQALRQLTAQTGKTRSVADSLIHSVIEIGAKSGYTAGEISNLTLSLGAAGRSLDSFTEDKVNTLSHLAFTFGLGADEATRFNSAADRLGADINNLTGQAAAFGKAFGIPGILSVLPDITNVAAESISMFGQTVTGNAQAIITNTMKASGILVKALGKDIREAANLAVQSFQKFSGEIRSNQKLMVGLADDISPLQMALLEGGAGWQGMMDIIRVGAKDPLVAADSIREMMKSMDPVRLDRFTIQMQEQLPEAIRELVFNEENHKRALDERTRSQEAANMASRAGIKDIQALTDGMRDNFSSARRVFESEMSSVGSLIESVFLGLMGPAIKDVTEYVVEFGKEIRGTIYTFIKSEEFGTFKEVFQKTAGFLVLAGQAAGFLARSLLSVEVATGLLTPLTYVLSMFQKLLTGLPGTTAKTFAVVTKSVYQGIGLFEAFGNTISEVKAVLGGSGTVLDKFNGVAKAVLGNLADYTNSFFFGLPNKIVKAFSKGADKDKATFRSSVMSLMTFGYEAIKTQLAQWNNDIPADLSDMWSRVGTDVGTKLGGIARAITDWIAGLFSKEHRETLKGNVQSTFAIIGNEKETIVGSLLSIGSKVLGATKALITSFADGFLSAYGTNLDIFIKGFKLSAEGYGLSIWNTFNTIKGGLIKFHDTVLPIVQGLGSVMASLSKGMISIAETMSNLVHAFEGVAIKFLEIKAKAPKILGGGLSAEEQIALNLIKAQQDTRRQGYEDLKKSIDGVNNGLKSMTKFGEDSVQKTKDEIETRRAGIDAQKKELDLQKEKIGLINSLSRGEIGVGEAVNRAITGRRFDLIPEIVKTATITAPRASEAGPAKAPKVSLNLSTKNVGPAPFTLPPLNPGETQEAKPGGQQSTPVSIEIDKGGETASPIAAGQKVNSTTVAASTDAQMVVLLQQILDTLMKGLSPEKRLMLIKIVLDETAKKNGFNYQLAQDSALGGQ